MHDEPNLSVAELEDGTDRTVLMLLMDEAGLWSLDEIRREVPHPLDVEDGVERLRAAGLVHRLEQFVFATRAAVKSQRLLA